MKNYPEASNHVPEVKAQKKEKVYLVCDWTDDKAASILTAPNIGVEHMGNCQGRILKEDGTEIGSHWSSSYGWLRKDLLSKLPPLHEFEVVDLIGKEVPERFKLKQEQEKQEPEFDLPEALWKCYFQMVYSNTTITNTSTLLLRQTFMAGMFAGFTELLKVVNTLPKEKSGEFVDKFLEELAETLSPYTKK